MNNVSERCSSIYVDEFDMVFAWRSCHAKPRMHLLPKKRDWKQKITLRSKFPKLSGGGFFLGVKFLGGKCISLCTYYYCCLIVVTFKSSEYFPFLTRNLKYFPLWRTFWILLFLSDPETPSSPKGLMWCACQVVVIFIGLWIQWLIVSYDLRTNAKYA